MIDKNEVEKLSKLAHLEFSDNGLDAITGDMEKIVAFADVINASVEGDISPSDSVPYENFRADEIKPSQECEKILSNAESENGMFSVKGGI